MESLVVPGWECTNTNIENAMTSALIFTFRCAADLCLGDGGGDAFYALSQQTNLIRRSMNLLVNWNATVSQIMHFSGF